MLLPAGITDEVELQLQFRLIRRAWMWYTERYDNNSIINKIQQDATVCRYLFTAKSLCMFRMSIAPIIRST